MDKLKCPECGSTNIRFDVRPARTKSKSDYYRTGIKDSWILPVGRKMYKSDRRYKTMCLCQNCGNLWKRKNPAVKPTIKGILLLACFVTYLAIIVAAFSNDPELTANRETYIVCAVVLTGVFAGLIYKQIKNK